MSIIHFVAEYYPHFIGRECRRGTRCVLGHTVWETDRLPGHSPALINRLDAVIVPSEWNRQVFRDSGVVIPIWVVPHLPRPERAATVEDRVRLQRRLPPLPGRRIFYTVSTWLERKSIGPLVAAFAEAFSHDDPVALVIKTSVHDLERVRRDPGHEGESVPVLPQFEAMIGRAVLRQGRLPPPPSACSPTICRIASCTPCMRWATASCRCAAPKAGVSAPSRPPVPLARS
ncbi:hypothetical protein [Ancylobacter sp. FA202]|uniref:hypothetical protein n=1 Tax=Ancylobacter sp. FA202 TaxID=1111106 RepID=UPI0003A2C63A|nr:hypothetical protein [Ancylobacter sp. FA202]